MYQSLHRVLDSCKLLEELVLYNASDEARYVGYGRDFYRPDRETLLGHSVSCRLRVLKLTGIRNWEVGLWDDCIKERLEVLHLEEVTIGTPKGGGQLYYGPGANWTTVFEMCLRRCENLTEVYLSSLYYFNGSTNKPIQPTDEDCEASLRLLDDVMLRCQALVMATSQNHVDIRGMFISLRDCVRKSRTDVLK